MVTLVVVTGVALTVGFVVWIADRRHQRYGLLLLPGVSLGSALILWIILQFAGAGYNPDVSWLNWLLPITASAGIAIGTAWRLGRHREQADLRALNKALSKR